MQLRSERKTSRNYCLPTSVACAWWIRSAAALSICIAPAVAAAQGSAWPSKTVYVVVGFGAGGVSDRMARVASTSLAEELKQSFVVENRVGGAGSVAATQVARSAPDGHTLFFAAAPQIAIIPKIQDVSYDPIADFAPVSTFFSGPYVLTVKPSLPAKSIPELVSYAKSRNLTYGSPGPGSITHLLSALFLARAGIEATHVPFRSGDQALMAMLGEQIDMYFSPVANVMPYAGGTQLTILGIAADKRIAQLPDVPTIGEFYPNTVLPSWNGFLAPAKTPKPIVDKLAQLVTKAANNPETVAAMTRLGIVPGGETPEQFAAQIKRDQPIFDAAIEAAKLKRR